MVSEGDMRRNVSKYAKMRVVLAVVATVVFVGCVSEMPADVSTGDSGIVRLTRAIDTERNPVWSPDGTRIAFECVDDGWVRDLPISSVSVHSDICVMNADGSGRRRLTDKQGDNADPAWSPDGGKVAFGSSRSGYSGIFVVGDDGSGLERMTIGRASHPTWSPDGTKIAYSLQDGRNAQIYVKSVDDKNLDGSRTVRISDGTRRDTEPTWSPDGSKIAFSSFGGEESDIYIVNPDGTGYGPLYQLSGNERSPAWSSDGRTIVFVHGGGFYRAGELHYVDVDGARFSRVTNGSLRGTNPSLNTDGSMLIFSRNVEGNTDVYAIGDFQPRRQRLKY